MTRRCTFARLPLALCLATLTACAVEVASPEGAASSVDSALRQQETGRVTLCHRPGPRAAAQTLVVAAPAVSAHLAHGDALSACTSGCTTAEECTDGDACTTDECTPDGSCRHAPVSCEDGNPCTVDACAADRGCVFQAAPAGTACDDGNDCTGADVCQETACRGRAITGCCHESVDCDDGDRCTRDACTAGSCVNSAAQCAVADACVAGFCDPATGTCGSAPVTCDDGDPCTVDGCDASSGCTHALDTRCDGRCPVWMALVDGTFCMDRYEASLTQVLASGAVQPWPATENPTGHRVVAVTAASVVPQVQISQLDAQAACLEAGKRLCTDNEWLRACRGSAETIYPYGSQHVDGACNDGVNDASPELATTGEHEACVSEDGIHDLVGNVAEWTADPNGTFRGGMYFDTIRNGVGCEYRTTAHDVSHWDATTGFRCCADAQ